MADNSTVKVNINVSDNKTVEKLIKSVERLNTALTKSKKLAQDIAGGMPMTQAAGSSDARYAASRASSTRGRSSSMAAEITEYGVGRSAIGTGAAGRDFANQAQGLGGLVRVYATYAANLFAVSAAFTALKNAADTTNLVTGLEQLSASSGKNLPKIAKDLEAVSGGAISFREAMTSTVQASAAGMSGENIKKMGTIALKASQALGISMPDALNRLTRGITKLEPELLDELGIFTKIDPAVTEYARSVGKTANSLTDFERRQAFANAVMEEGNRKFSAVQTQVNVYDRLLASLKNIAQSGLEVINKVLGPLVELLAQNPAALWTTLALIASTLLKQAIPAITQWRQQVHDTAEVSANYAKESKDFYEGLTTNLRGMTIQGKLLETVANKAEIASKKYKAFNNAIENAAFAGPIVSLRLLWSEVWKISNLDGTKISSFSRILIGLRGSALIAATSINLVASAFGNVLGYIGLITAAFSLVLDAFSENKEESARASQSLDALSSSTDNFYRTAERLQRLNPLESLQPENIAASTAAFKDLATSMEKAFIDAQEKIRKRGAIDTFWSWLKGLWFIPGSSDEQEIQKKLESGIDNLLKNSASSPMLLEARKQFAKSLGLNELASDTDIRQKALSGDILSNLQNLAKLADKTDNAGQSALNFKNNLGELSKTFKDISNELMPSGKLVDIVMKLSTVFDDLAAIMKGPLDAAALASIVAISQNTAAISMMGDAGKKLQQMQPDLLNAQAGMMGVARSASMTQEELSKAVTSISDVKNSIPKTDLTFKTRLDDTEVKTKIDSLAKTTRTIIFKENLASTVEEGLKTAYKNTEELIRVIHKNAIQNAYLSSQQEALGKLTPTEDTIKRQGEIERQQARMKFQESTVQWELVDSTISLSFSQEKLDYSMRDLRLAIEENSLILKGDKATQAEKDALAAKKESAKKIDETEAKRLENRIAFYKEYKQAPGKFSLQDIISKGFTMQEASRMQLMGTGRSAAAIQFNQEIAKSRATEAEKLANLNLDRLETQAKFRQTEIGARLKELAGASSSTTEGTETPAQLELKQLTEELRSLEDYISRVPSIRELYRNVYQGPLSGLSPEQLGKSNIPATEKLGQITISSEMARTDEDRKILAEFITDKYNKQKTSLKDILDLENTSLAAGKMELEDAKQLLEINKNQGSISSAEYDTQSRYLKLVEDELNFQQSLNNLRSDYLTGQKELQSKLEQAQALNKPEEDITAAQAALDAYNKSYAIKFANEYKNYELLQRRRVLEDSMNKRQLTYAQAFEDAFKGMADAMIEWAKTGKLSAREVFNSLVEGIVRYEMQLKALEMWAAAKPFIMSLLGSFIPGFSTAAVTSTVSGGSGISAPKGFDIWPTALGAAYDTGGVKRFAKGGAFTNSIVSNPTLFKFAKGTGLMGEAGPEAIMPLKRDSNGNLGVRGTQQKTEVVVNNYTGQQAQAKETEDGRGNRRIEIIVGDMTAGEIARNGSNTNKTMRANFGLQPQLIRR